MIAPLARTACVLAISLVVTLPAAAQDYPKRPIELVVPFVAGGTTDNIARLMAQRFSESWGQTVVVNNRAGGGSTIGTNAVAKAPPDGHTLLVTTIGFAINAGLQKLPYDPIGDFTPITELASLPLVLVVHASVPATNLQEFIALAKSKAGGWDYASSGTGTSPHLAAEMFKSMAGIELVHVPFKGNAEVLNALLGGHVKVHFALTASTLQHVRSGALRVLAVTTEQRLPDLPDSAELGLQADGPSFGSSGNEGAATGRMAKGLPCSPAFPCRGNQPTEGPRMISMRSLESFEVAGDFRLKLVAVEATTNLRPWPH